MLETLLATITAKNSQHGIRIMITIMVEAVQIILQDQDGLINAIKYIHWGKQMIIMKEGELTGWASKAFSFL